MKIMKRILALALCICMVVACWPAEALQAETFLSATETASYTLNGKKTTVYYEDDFAVEADYTAALGSYASNTSRLKWSNGGIAPDGSTRNAFFYGIKDAEQMQNYTVSADVKMGDSSKFTALIVYGTGNATSNSATGYEFGIVKAGGKELLFRLYQRGGRNAALVGGTEAYAVEAKLPGYNYETDTVNMRVQVATDASGNVTFNCYAALNGGTEMLIFENIKDEASTKFTSGVPGFRSTDKGGSITNVSVTRVEDQTNYLYEDTFSYGKGYNEALGVPNNGNLSLVNKALLIDTQANHVSLFKGITDAETLQNYTVSGDFVFDDDDGYNGVIAYGSQHPTKTNDSYGYEFAVVSGKFRLYRRSLSGAGKLAGDTNDDKVTTVFAEEGYKSGESIRLSLTAVTNADESITFTCKALYNEVEKTLYTVTDNDTNKITSGIPGIRGTNNSCTVDNVSITKVIVSTPDPGPTPDPEPNPDPQPQPVEITIPFAETFDRTQDELADYWNNGKDVTIQNVNGNNQLVLGGSIKNLYLTGDKDTLDWTNYVYEADVVMTDEDDVERDQSFASIIAAVNGENKGYEFSLMYVKSKDKCYVRLYDRIHATAIASPAFDFEFGEAVRLKMEVTEDAIKCYANGELMVTASNLKDVKGTIGMSILGKYAQFDNVSVTEYISVNPNPQPQPVEITIPFTEMFEGARETLSSYWNKGTTVTIETEDGNNQAVLDGTETSMYLTGDKDTLDWSNYAYEADVTMTEHEFNSNVDNTMATIVAAANESNKGYEFSLMYVKSKDAYYVRLYDRIHGKIIRTPRFDFEFGVPVVLRMEVTEDTIKCYANGELMITATDLEELSGTIGFVAAGRTAKFDNLSVTKYVEEKVTAPVANSEGIYYQDNFSNAVNLEDNKWNEPILNILNEQAIVSGDKGLLYLTGDEGYLTLKDYAVSAKVTVGAENDSYAKTIVGAIVARSEGESTGYELGIIHTGDSSYVRLYDRTAGKELAKNTDVAFEMGKEYILTMVCDGEQITCYVDGISVFTVKDGTNKAGTAGLRTIGTVYYDDFVVATPAYASRFVSYAPIISSPVTGDTNWNRMPLYVAMFVLAGALVGLEVVDLKRRKRTITE